MLYKETHLSDQDLLLTADGELSAHRQSQVRAHLQACWTCRARMAEIEKNIGHFMGGYHSLFPGIAAGADSDQDAQLRRRLSAQCAKSVSKWTIPVRWAYAAAAALLVLAGALFWFGRNNLDLTVPNPHLTPGEIRLASKRDVCQSNTWSGNEPIPESLKKQVFAEYGIQNAAPGAYEVDFLITPALGGSAGIRNLWPQPYFKRAWNAHVKDTLEDRLHSLVCDGGLDLSTAQHEIATNWVTAYKKYVRTDRPM